MLTRALLRRTAVGVRARALPCVAAAALAAGCVSRVCKERLLDLRESPDHRYNAALLVQSCDGGRNVVTHVNLHAGYGGPPAESDGRATRGEVFSIEGERKVSVTWKGARNLHVECVGCGSHRVFKKDGAWDDVQITYAERE